MKIIYKIFIFAIILKLLPVILIGMHVFPNVAFSNLGYDFDEHSDLYNILAGITGPYANSIQFNIPVIEYKVGVPIAFAVDVLIGTLVIVAIFRSPVLPVLVAGVTAFIIIPFLVDLEATFITEAHKYNSNVTILLIVVVFVGILVMGILTILESAKGTDNTVEDT